MKSVFSLLILATFIIASGNLFAQKIDQLQTKYDQLTEKIDQSEMQLDSLQSIFFDAQNNEKESRLLLNDLEKAVKALDSRP